VRSGLFCILYRCLFWIRYFFLWWWYLPSLTSSLAFLNETIWSPCALISLLLKTG
jgi:hypothetical protein